MKNARDGGIDAATVRGWFDDFNSRLGAYIRVLGRLRELTVLELTDNEWCEQQQFVDRLVEQLVAKYDRGRLRELSEWVQEQRQQAEMTSPRINGKLQPTALQFALWCFLFVGEAWKRTKQLGLSGNEALGHFHDCLKDRPPPPGDELHALLSDEHTLARRALKAMAVPKAQPAAVADAAPQWDKHTKARNKWLYDECRKGTAYQTIIFKLKGKPTKWPPIESVNGIKKAATAYADRMQLPPIQRRAKGRPKSN